MRTLLLLSILLAIMAPNVGAADIDECGVVQSHDGRYWFRPLSAPYREYGLDRAYGQAGKVVRAVGNIVECSGVCDPCYQDSCLADVSVLDCPPRDLGCGVQRGYGDIVTPCCHWESPEYGWVEFGNCPYEDGDSLHVIGLLDYAYSNPICLFSPPSLREETVQPCSEAHVPPRIVQTGCDTLSLDPPLTRILFDITNPSGTPVCYFTLFANSDSCSVQDCSVPAGWSYILDAFADGWTWLLADYEEGCIVPGSGQGPFELIVDPADCCYQISYYRDFSLSRQPFFGETVCFECDRPVQVESMTWGHLKALYR